MPTLAIRRRTDLTLRVCYAVLAVLAAWYLYLTPIALMGYWRNQLVPGLHTITNFLHVYFVAAVWVVSRSRRKTLLAGAAVVILGTAIQFLLGAYPTVAMISRFGLPNYVENWVMMLLQCIAGPAIATLLLLKADQLGPMVFRNWSNDVS